MAIVEKTSKIREIKESLSWAVEIMSQIRTPGMQESFGKMMDTANIARDIIESLKSADMVKNIENLRAISDNISKAASRMQYTMERIDDTGIADEAKGLIRSAKGTMDLISNKSQDILEIGTSVKDLFRTIRTAHDSMREGFDRKYTVTDHIVIVPDELEEYLRMGWQFLTTLPDGKMVIKK